jgi:hypothetical protein
VITTLILISLATYRLTRLIGEDMITEPLRDQLNGLAFHPNDRIGKFFDWVVRMVNCPHCLSVWAVGIVGLVWLIPVVGPALVLLGAAAGIVSLLHTVLDYLVK